MTLRLFTVCVPISMAERVRQFERALLAEYAAEQEQEKKTPHEAGQVAAHQGGDATIAQKEPR